MGLRVENALCSYFVLRSGRLDRREFLPGFGQYTEVGVILPVLVKPLRGTGCLEAHFDVFLSVEGTRGQAQGLPLRGLKWGEGRRLAGGEGRHKAAPTGALWGEGSVALGACEGRHEDGTCGKQLGRRVGLRNPVEQALGANVDTRSMRHVVGGGALRGRSPRTREGRIGPTAQNCSS